VHLLSALLHEEKVVVAQRAVGEKTNEIPEVKRLLEPLNIQGAIVTLDALHTQTETARYLVEEKKADYVLVAKDNQETLKSDIAALTDDDFSP
jgi:predicted transposase YbfD/YdcC